MKNAIALFLVLFGSFASAEAKKPLVILDKDNTVVLNDEVNDATVSKAISDAMALDSLNTSKPIYLVLKTPGGSVESGLLLIESMSAMKRPVNTITLTSISMGFQIVQGLGERLTLQSSTFMSHPIAGQIGGSMGMDGSQIENRLSMWKQMVDQMDKRTVSRTNGKQTLLSYRKAYQNELWLTGENAVAEGYADKVIAARCDASLNGSQDSVLSFLGMDINVKISACPLVPSSAQVQGLLKTNQGKMTLEEFKARGGVFGSCSLVVPLNKPLCPTDLTLTEAKFKDQVAETDHRFHPGH